VRFAVYKHSQSRSSDFKLPEPIFEFCVYINIEAFDDTVDDDMAGRAKK
jgi:hypothetical protein